MSWVISNLHMLAHCPSSPIASAKLKLYQLFEGGGIYGFEWHLAKSKLSNELERGGTYGMTYDTNIDTYI